MPETNGLLPPRCPHRAPTRAFYGAVFMRTGFGLWGVNLMACSIECLRELCRYHLDEDGMRQARAIWPALGDVRPLRSDVLTFHATLSVPTP